MDYKSVCSALTLQSKKDGFFHQFAESVTEAVDEDWLESFRKLSRKEKIKHCYTNSKIRDKVHGTLENVREIFRGKCDKMSLNRKMEGDVALENGKYARAFQLYTQSIMRSSSGEDGCIALAFWARANVLLKLQKYRLCLIDIKLSLKGKLQTSQILESYWNMSECYMKLDDKTKAQITLNILKTLLEQNGLYDLEWKEKIDGKKKEIQSYQLIGISKKGGADQEESTPDLTSGSRDDLPAASKVLKLANSKKEGRFIIAAESINPGNTLITEDPYVACLLPDMFGSHCQHCFKRLESAIPCKGCAGIAFCSTKCKDESWTSYHKFECRYMDLMIGSGMSILCFLALRIVTQKNLKYFQKFEEGQTKDHEYFQIQNLEGHEEERSVKDFLHRTLMALFLLKILQKSGYFGEEKTKDSLDYDELLIGSILLRNLEIVQFNAHEISETINLKDKSESKTIPIAFGLYKTSSYFNHDCYPSIARYFIGKKIIIKALRPLQTNEMIGDNYGPTFANSSLKKRQKILESRYWFTCNCKACLENWPSLDDLSKNRIKCPKCNNIFTFESNIKSPTCGVCKKQVNGSIFENLRINFTNGLKNYEEKRYTVAEKILLDYLKTAHSLYEPPSKYLTKAHDILRKCWLINKGNIWNL